MIYTINVDIPDQYKKLSQTQIEAIINLLINNYFDTYADNHNELVKIQEDIWNKDYLSHT
jgi:hypothetical protein